MGFLFFKKSASADGGHDAFGILGNGGDVPEQEPATGSGGDGFFEGKLTVDFRGGPALGLEAIDGDAGNDRDASRVDLGISPPGEQGRKTLWAAVFPIQLRREVIDPSLPHPDHGVGEEFVVLIHADFDVRGRGVFAVDAEGADAKKQARAGGVDSLAEVADEEMDILAAPVGLGEFAAGGAVGCVGFVVGKMRESTLGRGVGVELVIEVDARDVVALDEFAHDGVDVAADFGRAGVHPKRGADFVAILGIDAADVF